MSAEEISSIVTPSDESRDLITAWLEENGITDAVHSPSKDWIHVVIPIEKAEKLLDTSYSIYRHEDGSVLDRTPEWSLPIHLHDHIDVIQPTNSFFRPLPKRVASSVASSGAEALTGEAHSLEWWDQVGKGLYGHKSSSNLSAICNISFTTPECIRTLYGTIDYKPQAAKKNSVAVTNYLNQTSYRADIYQFLKMFRPEAAPAAKTFPIVIIADAVNNQGPLTDEEITDGINVEANLDAEQVLSVSYPTPFTAYSTGGSPPFMPDLATPTNTNEPYLVFLQYILAQKNVPNVLSTSYGDDEQTIPRSYANKVCSGFAQLGARGVSVLFSSGDNGVGSSGKCYSNTEPKEYKFLPAFPAGCPWVTAVGGTEAFEPEVAVKRFGSGAGFSEYFPAPSYQAKTVAAYIKSLKGLYDGFYNKKGRGYPDVAAQGNRDALVSEGKVRTVGGTSASSPTFAGVIALVNDALIAKGKPVLGFLNPWIYSGAYKALNDVTSGSSFGCNTTGFPAQKGWDAVTGFGTPNFPKLVDAAFAKYNAKPY